MKILKMAAVKAGLIGLLVAFAPTAHAASVIIDDITGTWSNVTGGQNVSGVGTSTLSWGRRGTSSYDFEAAAPPDLEVDTDDIFSIGDFTHNNQPILIGTGIDGAQLDVTINIVGPIETGPYTFGFMHNETPNRCSGPNCADDIVTISSLITSDMISIDGTLYTLNILGFSTDGGNTISTIFSSPEGGANMASLYAQFTVVTPLPAALPLFLTVLAGMGFLRWRRRNSSAVA